jgi:Zn-dependent protease
MTMTTHTRGPLQRTPSATARPTPFKTHAAAADLIAADLAARRAAHLAMIGQFCRIGLTILLAGGALAGIIALKTMVYFWRYNYY